MKLLNPKIRQKFAESLKAVLPVVGIVIVLSFTIAPITSSILLCFLVGALMVMVGMMFFTLGAEMSMTPMGEKVGARMTQSKNILLIVVLSFLLGVVITISEPDLQVLATQVPSVPNMTLILAVAVGVGIFLVIALVLNDRLPDSFHGSVHVGNPHIRNTVYIDFCIQHHVLKIFMADHFRKQPVIEVPGR